MGRKRLGQALFEVGCHAAGWTAMILFLFGGVALLTSGSIQNPFLLVLAWGQLFVLGAGLVLMAVGHVLRSVADDPGQPAPADRVPALEQELARLRSELESLRERDGKPPTSTGIREVPG